MRDGHKNTPPGIRSLSDIRALNIRYQAALDLLPGLRESLIENKTDLRDLKQVDVFGYGSLVDKPHYPPQEIRDAFLWGWSRSLCCKSVRSGTPELPGLTLGLDKDEEGIVPGSVLNYKIQSMEQLCEMLEAFAEREVVKAQPIYKFEFLEIETDDGSKRYALVCVADPTSDGYVGDALTPGERQNLPKDKQRDLSIFKKSQILNMANGELKSGLATGFSYFTRFMWDKVRHTKTEVNPHDLIGKSDVEKKRIKALAKEAKEVQKLYDAVQERREETRKVQPEYVAFLESVEDRQWQAHIAAQKEIAGLRKSGPNPYRPK